MILPVKIEDFVLTIGNPCSKEFDPYYVIRELGGWQALAGVNLDYTKSGCIDGVSIGLADGTDCVLLKPVCHDDFSESWIIVAQTDSEVVVHNKRFYLKGTPSRESRSRDEGLASPDDIVAWLQTILIVESVF